MPASPKPKVVSIGPQKGTAQERFLSATADICIFGGSAGSGKSWGLLIDAARWIDDPLFRAVIFRRTYQDIENPGGLWDASMEVYPKLGGEPTRSDLVWRFPSGARIQFAHLQHDSDVSGWYGAELPWIGIDECQFFGELPIVVLMSRNRSMCSVTPYMRLTCNANAEAWVASFVAWWIDQETGYPIQERAGVVRWFVRRNNEIIWADNKEELYRYIPDDLPCDVDKSRLVKSASFIPAKIYDNPLLMKNNPEYLGTLLSMPLVERERLLEGNWKIMPTAGQIIQPGWFAFVDAVPAAAHWVRAWDIAATEAKVGTDPDYTVGIKMCQHDGVYYIDDVVRERVSPHKLERLVRGTADNDGEKVRIVMEKDPAAAGKIMIQVFTRLLDGYYFKAIPLENKSKEVRWNGFAGQVEAGNVKLKRATWNRAFLDEMRDLGSGHGHDDQGDAAATAFRYLFERRRVGGIVAMPLRRY